MILPQLRWHFVEEPRSHARPLGAVGSSPRPPPPPALPPQGDAHMFPPAPRLRNSDHYRIFVGP